MRLVANSRTSLATSLVSHIHQLALNQDHIGNNLYLMQQARNHTAMAVALLAASCFILLLAAAILSDYLDS
jgi:hypothetical protein